MTFVWVLASVLVSATLSVAQDGSKYFITAPNIFRVGVEQTVSVTVFNADQVNVELYLQDYPDRKKTFSQTEGVFSNGKHIAFSYFIPQITVFCLLVQAVYEVCMRHHIAK
ncbi:uncharacterized protein LOC102802869, partial [Saccoglossus kowalevskii]|uniref:Uncharacterized protein LOC102802869 n=1 Tax=Saccoglossus kowalevskii TaxID=10224 RepID=A0ABM0MQ58_SACKO